MKQTFHAGLTIFAVAVCAVAAITASNVYAEGGDAARGKDAYFAHGCYGCHGYNGETGWRDLVGTNSPLVATEEIFLLYLRSRTDYAPLVPSTRMPAYPESALSDADARDIFTYIQTFELNAPEVEDIPALQAILESAGKLLDE